MPAGQEAQLDWELPGLKQFCVICNKLLHGWQQRRSKSTASDAHDAYVPAMYVSCQCFCLFLLSSFVLVLAFLLACAGQSSSDAELTTDAQGNLHINTSSEVRSVFINGLDIGSVSRSAWHVCGAGDCCDADAMVHQVCMYLLSVCHLSVCMSVCVRVSSATVYVGLYLFQPTSCSLPPGAAWCHVCFKSCFHCHCLE